jgi:hypothetical protein
MQGIFAGPQIDCPHRYRFTQGDDLSQRKVVYRFGVPVTMRARKIASIGESDSDSKTHCTLLASPKGQTPEQAGSDSPLLPLDNAVAKMR